MQFAPFASDIDLAFFSSLAYHKINYDKLDTSARRVLGVYEINPADAPANSCRMQIGATALTSDEPNAGHFRGEGIIRNVNTIEEFKKTNYSDIIQKSGRTIWEAILDGSIYSIPSLLSSFTIISFADLKKYHFHYWCGFPAIHSSPPWSIVGERRQFNAEETSSLADAVSLWRYSVDSRQRGFFLFKRVKPATGDEDTVWVVKSLGEYEQGFFNDVKDMKKDAFVAFADPSNFDEHPGWPLRNLLVLIRKRWKLKEVNIVGYRDVHAQRHHPRSVIWTMKDDAEPDLSDLSLKDSPLPKITGWERNREKKLLPRFADLSQMMDPTRLADSAVDLNNRLMKWRIAPDLDLDKIKETKCLLLGAGTLGAYVSRILLGWGVRKITLIDNATVSYSNPVRQPLFTFEDCHNGGKPKAARAAEALKEIYPNVDAQGFKMMVPMAGHPIRDKTHEEQVKADYEKLIQLIQEHDAIFLLMDTRESRWLPTVLGKFYGKIVLNAALGFDTFVVMRHGVRPEIETEDESEAPDAKTSTSPEPISELGCYFCNDVVAPADSIKDQTLDQMCTVTRPGIAAIASALLVELFVSILQHPQLGACPAPATPDDDRGSHPLGTVPHQIRGFLFNFQNKIIRAPGYNHCSACSNKILSAFDDGGWEFVKRAMNESGYIEEVSGLAEVQRAAAAMDDELDWSEEDNGDGDGEMI
ncbi:Autophagy protein 7 [Orbilia ellipsospora]|uniref:Ubiquitin-like modifier-activating enzyme ATG7 n=1 Tax=Orbilia ellipsospora TaxID=2528407 RepID=A0AAV9XLB3_9PEZI